VAAGAAAGTAVAAQRSKAGGQQSATESWRCTTLLHCMGMVASSAQQSWSVLPATALATGSSIRAASCVFALVACRCSSSSSFQVHC
jgi:hypothetical protein